MAAVGLGIVGVRIHTDDRRTFYGDIFDTPNGDINIVCPRKGVPIGWHRHRRQDDRLFLVSGTLKVQTIDPGKWRITEHLGDGTDRRALTIPCGVWHGYEAITENTIVLQFNGPGKWDGTDEERMPLDRKPWSWE